MPLTAFPTFRQGLNEVGFAEGRNLAIEFRFANIRIGALSMTQEAPSRFEYTIGREPDGLANQKSGLSACGTGWRFSLK